MISFTHNQSIENLRKRHQSSWLRDVMRHGSVICLLLFSPLLHAVQTFADEDRSAQLAGQPVHQRYQFNTPTTVTYDRDSIGTGAANARVYVADMGSHRIRVLDLNGQSIGMLDDADQMLAADSPATTVPAIQAPLGIAFLSQSEAQDMRLAGLYVNDVGLHQIHFFRTDPLNPDTFYYVTSFGSHGSGGGQELTLPRNLVVTPQGYAYVSDEFNHRIKVFKLNPNQGYQATLVQTLGWQDSNGHPVGAGPILRGVDKDYGTNSSNYDNYANAPDKRDGWRIPQGMTYFRAPGGATFIYVADNGNNRIKIFRANANGTLTLFDMLGRFRTPGYGVDHLKRPRGLRTDAKGNLYVADTYNGRVLMFPNLASVTNTSQPVRYRSSGSADARADWMYGRLGIHQVEMRLPNTAGTEDAAFQLPNDLVPVIDANGEFYRENIWAWGWYYSNARVHLVSDSGNNRIKKCWTSSSGITFLRCSVSQGVGTATAHEFWGHPRTLDGQLHSASGMVWLTSKNRLLVSDTPNTRINMYNASGQYQGRFGGTDISIGVTGIGRFEDGSFGESVAVLVGGDVTLPWPYTSDSSLRIYDANGNLKHQFSLTNRSSGLTVPAIGLLQSNYPVAVSVRSKVSGQRQHAIYITSFASRVWRFDYNAQNGTLNYVWNAGGADASKGTDIGSDWNLGTNFYAQGAAGSYDQIASVYAGAQRIYVTDKRNQRVQAHSPATGALLGQFGQGGGIYDHPVGLAPNQLFLPAGLGFDAARGTFLVADGFNMVARAWNNPDNSAVSGGMIAPTYQGHWLNPALGTRPGGLFDAELITSGGNAVYVFSLISNRITRFGWNEMTPP